MAQDFVSSTTKSQKIRLQRFYMSVAMYAVTVIPQLLSYLNGISPGWVMAVWAVFSLVANGFFYWLFRTGHNLRFADPSLTMMQMLAALVLAMFTMLFAGEARGAYLLVLMLIMVFGCFKLGTRQLLSISALIIVAYGLSIPLIKTIEGADFNPVLEAILWCSFTPFLICLSVLSGSISGLRHKLYSSKQELEKVLQQVTELATRDELTSLYNRRYLLEMISHEKNRCDRGGGGFCLCIFDIDHFKKVNDQYGHLIGDQVLKSFARTVEPLLRSTDLFARYGGEEFMLFLPHTTLEYGQQCIRRIQQGLTQMECSELPEGLKVTASIGIAQYMCKEEVDSLIRRADAALYRAKEAGRNRLEFAEWA